MDITGENTFNEDHIQNGGNHENFVLGIFADF